MSFHPRSHPYRKIASIAAVLFAATRFSASAVPAAKPAGPQAIPFTIGHADCAGEGELPLQHQRRAPWDGAIVSGVRVQRCAPGRHVRGPEERGLVSSSRPQPFSH